jgi:imidazolonepropionase-like amidohydrolase
MSTVLFRNAAVLDAALGLLIPDQGVCVEDGRIRQVGDTAEVTAAHADRVIDVGGEHG